MEKIVIFDGPNEESCSKLFLKTAYKKLFLYFGLNYKSHSQYFEESSKPQAANSTDDLSFLGLAPLLRHSYITDLVQLIDKNGSDTIGSYSEQLSAVQF